MTIEDWVNIGLKPIGHLLYAISEYDLNECKLAIKPLKESKGFTILLLQDKLLDFWVDIGEFSTLENAKIAVSKLVIHGMKFATVFDD